VVTIEKQESGAWRNFLSADDRLSITRQRPVYTCIAAGLFELAECRRFANFSWGNALNRAPHQPASTYNQTYLLQ